MMSEGGTERAPTDALERWAVKHAGSPEVEVRMTEAEVSARLDEPVRWAVAHDKEGRLVLALLSPRVISFRRLAPGEELAGPQVVPATVLRN